MQEQLKRDSIVRETKEFAFTKLMVCGCCGSGISAEEKYKKRRDGTALKYIYYGCSRARDRHCGNKYIREEELIDQLLKVIDEIEINELGMRQRLEEEMKRFSKFQSAVLGDSKKQKQNAKEIDVRTYAKYLLREGSISEKRELLVNLRSRLVCKDKQIKLLK